VTRRSGDGVGAIIVAMTNSAVDVDPRVGADTASQEAQPLLVNTPV
jgi:hypothetical protein